LPKPELKKSTSATLILIGAWKLVEALALLFVAIGLHHYFNRDISGPILHLVHVFRMDPDNHFIHKFLTRALSISPQQIREFSLGSFIYAALRLVEGIGLVMRKRWAEYLVVIMTAVFIPLEVYEVFHRFTAIRCGLLVLNIAVVVYLIRNLRKH
jgi:uncharacterized membrane protein (DUF2068 family)